MLRSIKPWQHHRILPGIGRLAIDPRRKMPRSQCSKTVKFTTAIPAYCSPSEMRRSRSRQAENGLSRTCRALDIRAISTPRKYPARRPLCAGATTLPTTARQPLRKPSHFTQTMLAYSSLPVPRTSAWLRRRRSKPATMMRSAISLGVRVSSTRPTIVSYCRSGLPSPDFPNHNQREAAMSPISQPIAAVSPEEVRAMLRDGAEMALIDVREEGVFSEEGHPFFANSVPLSRLELMIGELVPRLSARVVVHDGGPGALDGDDLAGRAATRLASMGYRDVRVMAGGTQAWAAAGFQLFTGVNV